MGSKGSITFSAAPIVKEMANVKGLVGARSYLGIVVVGLTNPLLLLGLFISFAGEEPRPSVTRVGLETSARKAATSFPAIARPSEQTTAQGVVAADLENKEPEEAAALVFATTDKDVRHSSAYSDLTRAMAPTIPAGSIPTFEALVQASVGMVVHRNNQLVVSQGSAVGPGVKTAVHCLTGPAGEARPLTAGEEFDAYMDCVEYRCKVVRTPEVRAVTGTSLTDGVVLMSPQTDEPYAENGLGNQLPAGGVFVGVAQN